MKGIPCILLLAIASIDGRRGDNTNIPDCATCCKCTDSQYLQGVAPARGSYDYQEGIGQTVYRPQLGLNINRNQNNYGGTAGSQTPYRGTTNRGNGGFRDSSSAQPIAPSFRVSQGRNEAIAEITDFSWNLFKNVLDQESGNVVLSPVVSQFQLAILEKAAAGKTRQELRKITGSILATYLRKILSTSDGSSVLELANAIFVDSSVPLSVNQSFVNDVQKLNTVIRPYDFKRDAERAILDINAWAAESTRNTIKEIIPRQFPLQNVQMLLSSAIYFQGVWKNKFNDSDPDLFTNEDGQTVQVPFMEIKNNILYDKIPINRIDMQVLEIPYEGDNYAMLLILPDDERINLINNIVKSVNSTFISNIVERMSQNSPQRLTLKMPKFKITSTTRLRQVLQSMGLIDLFTSSARLPELGSQSQVDEILHQGVLNVDEYGTTAAAISTSFLIPLSADSVINQKIVINKPFLSIIYDKNNNIPLFISKISKL